MASACKKRAMRTTMRALHAPEHVDAKRESDIDFLKHAWQRRPLVLCVVLRKNPGEWLIQ